MPDKSKFQIPVAMAAWVASLLLLLGLLAAFSIFADGSVQRARAALLALTPPAMEQAAQDCSGVIFRDEDPQCGLSSPSQRPQTRHHGMAEERSAKPLSFNSHPAGTFSHRT